MGATVQTAILETLLHNNVFFCYVIRHISKQHRLTRSSSNVISTFVGGCNVVARSVGGLAHAPRIRILRNLIIYSDFYFASISKACA